MQKIIPPLKTQQLKQPSQQVQPSLPKLSPATIDALRRQIQSKRFK